MINGTLVTILSIGILILLSNLYKNIEPMEIISSKKYKAKPILNVIEKLLNKLKYKKHHIRFQEYDDIQRNKIWHRHVDGLNKWKEKRKDRRKDLRL
jgi:ribosomal protein L17